MSVIVQQLPPIVLVESNCVFAPFWPTVGFHRNTVMRTSAGLGKSRQRCISARSKWRLPKMLDGIKLEDHPLRSGPATLGVMLGKSLP